SYLYLRWLCASLQIPRIGAALGMLGPLRWIFRMRHGLAALEQAAAEGRSALVFLGAGEPDPFPDMVRLQERLERPLFLFPALLVWSRRAQKLRPSIWDLLFGSPEAPSKLATLIAFLRNYRRAFLRVGTPIDLLGFSKERSGEAAAVRAR